VAGALRRGLRRIIYPFAYRWYTWLFGTDNVTGGDGRDAKTLIFAGFSDYDAARPDRPPLVILQVGLAVVPGPRIIARTVLSPGDAYEFFRAGIDNITEQTRKFGDETPRRFDTTQINLEEY
jgi:hypothetical protein